MSTMNRQTTPTLWLRCGRCGGTPNLATLSARDAMRLTGHGVPVSETALAADQALPGESFVVDRRRDGDWRPVPVGQRWSHKFGCRRCGAVHPVSGERLAAWWAEFTATRRRHDVRYLGRDR